MEYLEDGVEEVCRKSNGKMLVQGNVLKKLPRKQGRSRARNWKKQNGYKERVKVVKVKILEL
jgi:hypothetical protein